MIAIVVHSRNPLHSSDPRHSRDPRHPGGRMQPDCPEHSVNPEEAAT